MARSKQTILARNAALSRQGRRWRDGLRRGGFVSYNLAPPLKATGGKAGLAAWFATWDGPIGHEMRDLKIIAGDEAGFAHGLIHMSGRKTDGEVIDLWFRQTFGLKRHAAAGRSSTSTARCPTTWTAASEPPSICSPDPEPPTPP